ncbi:hypothetical protein [Nakamurella antarctica]|uniref:hypothetical protein n=1 Tax=Nakamurella antarctica TaxID=1902245 RepID=UPI0013DE79D5|nr:hypothetical protein [Nakamurella antarctica]
MVKLLANTGTVADALLAAGTLLAALATDSPPGAEVELPAVAPAEIGFCAGPQATRAPPTAATITMRATANRALPARDRRR